MGTWGHRAFENDGALDWVASLAGGGLAVVEKAFDAVLESDGEPEAPTCDEAIAAAEAMTILLGKVVPQAPGEVTAWAAREKSRPTAALLAKARKSLERILDDSELKDLWEESGEADKWRNEVLGLMESIPSADSLPSERARTKPWWKPW